jgi:sulfate permease, SulP family
MNGIRAESRRGLVARWIPCAEWLRGYSGGMLRGDVVAGLSASSVVVPQAMAYAAIAGLPLVTGLYTALVPLVVYAVMGTSRPLSVTTTSTIAILTAGALHGLPAGMSADQLLTAAYTLAFLVGVVLLIASILRLGVVASFISEPVLVGFKAGVGLTIVIDQIPKLLGVQIPRAHFFHNLVHLAEQVPQASVPTVLLAAGMLGLLLGLEWFLPRVPAALVVVAAGIGASAIFGLSRYGIALVGEVHGGLPPVTVPDRALFEELWPAAIGIALMSFVETVAAGQAFRDADEPAPNANKELAAIGLTNLVGSFFQNMPSGGGTSQTAVNRQVGARTQVAGVVTAGMVAAVLLFLAPVIHLMPMATLAAVVVVPCAGMVRLRAFKAIYRFRLMEFSWAMASVAGVVVLGTLRGIIVAVMLSLLSLVYQANRWPVLVLARKRGTDVFRPVSPQHPTDETFPGLLMLKMEGTVHFANAKRIINQIWKLIDEHEPRVVVIDCSAIPDIEYTALRMVTEMDKKLREAGIALWLAALNPEPLKTIERTELGEELGHGRMCFNLEQAVAHFQAQASGEARAASGLAVERSGG